MLLGASSAMLLAELIPSPMLAALLDAGEVASDKELPTKIGMNREREGRTSMKVNKCIIWFGYCLPDGFGNRSRIGSTVAVGSDRIALIRVGSSHRTLHVSLLHIPNRCRRIFRDIR